MNDMTEELRSIEYALKRLNWQMSMISLRPADLGHAQEVLEQLVEPVAFVYFTEENQCRHCRQEKDILAELSAMHTRLRLEMHDFKREPEEAEGYGIDKAPCTVLVGKEDYGVRYYGMPAGYEFRTFMRAVLMVSRGESGLATEQKQRIRAVESPLRIEVFTTASCPFSEIAMQTAQQLAVENDRITGEVVDVADFPELVRRHKIMTAPTTIVNGEFRFHGAASVDEFVDQVLKGAEQGKG